MSNFQITTERTLNLFGSLTKPILDFGLKEEQVLTLISGWIHPWG